MEDSAIKKDYIRTGIHAGNKNSFLHQLAEQSVANGIADDVEKTYEGFLEREQECSTGFTDGFAIPHTRCGSVKKTAVLINRLDQGIDWPSMDGQPTDFVIALMVPGGDRGADEHMRLLSHFSRLLVNADFRKSLRQAESSEEIYRIFKERII